MASDWSTLKPANMRNFVKPKTSAFYFTLCLWNSMRTDEIIVILLTASVQVGDLTVIDVIYNEIERRDNNHFTFHFSVQWYY